MFLSPSVWCFVFSRVDFLMQRCKASDLTDASLV